MLKSLLRPPTEYELPYPIPYAVAPSAQGDGWISFTYRGCASSQVAFALFIGLIVVLVMLVLLMLATEWRTMTPDLLVQSIFALILLVPSGIVLSVLMLRGRRREEFTVSIADGLVRSSKEGKAPGQFGEGRLLVVPSRTYKPKSGSVELLLPSLDISLVVLAGGERYGVLGAFRSHEIAMKYADSVSEYTRLSIGTDVPETLRVVRGDITLGGRDEAAIERPHSDEPLFV